MARRSYGQHCGLAVALDLLGERWTLLIVRDLLPGPRRFSDLFNGLPGISTDLLADRLRALEAADVIRQRRLQYPVPATVYELTDAGNRLQSTISDLARWGQPLLSDPKASGYRVNPRWALQSMTASYQGGLPDGSFEFVIDDEILTVIVEDGRARVIYGPPPDEPHVEVRCSTEQFLELATSPRPRHRLLRGIHVVGDAALVEQFVRAMPLRSGMAATRRR